MSAASDMMRKMCKEGDDKRDAGLTTPKDIERFDDIVYEGTTERSDSWNGRGNACSEAGKYAENHNHFDALFL